jgi:type IV secretory pathway protease TraF
MIKVNKKNLRNVTIILTIFVLTVTALRHSGLIINLSDSHVPVGVYMGYPPDNVAVGDIVMFNIRDLFRMDSQLDGGLDLHFPQLIKKVAALPGAVIERSGDMIIIDGKPFGKARIVHERLCKVTYPRTVPDGYVWLMADKVFAYDSRYYGEVPIEIILSKDYPVLIWKRPG